MMFHTPSSFEEPSSKYYCKKKKKKKKDDHSHEHSLYKPDHFYVFSIMADFSIFAPGVFCFNFSATSVLP